MSTQDLHGRKSALLQRYQPKAASQDPLNQPMDATKSTSQRSLQNSSLLQKYYQKTASQDIRGAPPAQPEPSTSSSQRSLNQSKLLQRYYKQNSQDSQDAPKQEPQRYSSQKSLESSKLMQRYNPVNNSQEFSGLAVRESTPVARLARSGSLDHDRIVRPSSLLSKYTPRFGKSLDRNKTIDIMGYSNYSSQQSLEQQDPPQNQAPSQSFGEYGGDHFDQYDTRNLRSRSSSMARGLARKSAQSGLETLSRRLELEKENIPLDPVTPETLPVVATSEPVMGNIASALPMPMLQLIPPTPAVEFSKTPLEPALDTLRPAIVQQAIIPPEPEKPKRQEPVKPPRKDIVPPATVSIPIPIIKNTLTVEPPKVITPTKQEALVVPKDPSPPLFSNRDRMQHYGSASDPMSSPPPSKQEIKSAVPAHVQVKKNTLMAPISDFSSRRSMTDLRQSKEDENNPFAMDIDESSDRNDLRSFSKNKDSVKSTLASAFEQITALSVPQASSTLADEEERIESLPADRKLKKRDHTYHPSFVPKQSKQEENERKKQEEKAKQELHKKEQERKKEEERIRKEEEKIRKEEDKIKKGEEKHKKDDEKRRKEEEKRLKAEEEKRRKEEDKIAKDDEKRLKEEERRKKDEEKKKQKEEKKKNALQKIGSAEQETLAQPEEEISDFGSHLEQYSISGPPKPRGTSVGRPRSGGTPHGSQGALNHHTLPALSTTVYGSQQSLDRSGGVQSKMLERYAQRRGSQDITHTVKVAEAQQFKNDVHRSQGSLEHQRASRSTLLQKYTPRPLGTSMAAGQTVPSSATPKSTSQVSLDKNRIEKSSLLQRYKPRSESADGQVISTSETTVKSDKDHMSTIVFQAKKRPEKHSVFDYRDHEYEPIGEPVDTAAETKPPATAASLAVPTDKQARKLSSASLRVPGEEGDTVSMQDLQNDIEDRYFNRPTDATEGVSSEATEPVEATQEKTNKMKAVMSRAQESGKKAMARAQESSKNAMTKAQEGGKSLHQKLRKQTDKFKTKMTNINIKKDKDVAPLASPEIVTTPEIEKFDFTIAEPKPEQETGELEPAVEVTEETVLQATSEEASGDNGTAKKKFKTPEFSKLKNIHMPKIQKPEFKRPEFTKITKPKMPNMSKFKRPEMPKFLTEKPDFSKLKMPDKIGAIKLQRSKSMKEPAPSDATSVASPSDAETPSVIGADGSKKKVDYTDFSTFPRFLDKFKKQKSVPASNASVRASTPPPLEFTKAGKTSRPKGATFISRWAEKSSEDTGSNRFFSGSELGERESSVEKRIRQRLERADFDAPELPVTAEQKQLEEYDKENREIHLLSAARHDEFIKRKPPMERQESDLASEEEKQFWASSLGQKIRQNIDMNSNDFDFLDEEDRLRVARESETMGLSERDRARFLGEPVEHSEKDYDMRSTTPYSNKECQSSGSSGIRRRKGVLEEIDDDEFFLRQKGISKDNIKMGEYISSAIKEGLSTPKNALAEMGRYDSYYDEDMDASERMSMDYRGERGGGGFGYYQPSFESDDISNKQSFTDEFRRNAEFYRTFPPDRPTRKQKKSYSEEQYDDEQQKEYQQEQEDGEFYGRDRKYASEQPRNQPEKDERYIDEESIGNGFSRTGEAVPPTPPRRRKKRFRDVTPSDLGSFANGLAAKSIYNSFTIGPETHVYRADVPLAQEESFTTPLPTPRRSRSRSQISKLFDDDRTSRGAESYIFGAEDNAMVRNIVDMSESNGYAIVRKEPPPRPPAPIRRRKSTRSLGDHQFNTLPNYHSVSPMRPSRNYSTISPNRPPRGKSYTSLNESLVKSNSVSREDVTQYEEIEGVDSQSKLHHTLQSGEVVNKMKDRPLPPPPRPPRDSKKPRKPDPDDRYDLDGGAEKISTWGPRVIEEVEIAIQTDPVGEDYELDMEVSQTIGADKPVKTLHEILKEEQQAEVDRARQLTEATNLMRGIQKFRESSTSLSLHGSRPETPATNLIERRVSTPSASNIRVDRITSSSPRIRPLSVENLTDQDLANADDDRYIAELVNKYVSEEKVSETSRKQQKVATSNEMDSAKLREIESMIVRDEIRKEESRPVRSEPAAPPRRRSLVASSQDLSRSVDIPSNVIEEIVERLRTNEQQHIAELQQLQQQQLDDMKKQHEEQKRHQDQKLEEQQKQLLDQQNQQLHETQQLKEQIQQQQEQQKALLQQQQQQQQQLLLAQQQQQLLLEQQEKERELQRERERELLREREIELEKSRERERELHHAREMELQRARDLEQQRARELEQQRLRELEMQRAMELEHQRLRELEMQRTQEAEIQRAREAEHQRAREAEHQRAREHEFQRIRDAEMQRVKEAEKLRAKEVERAAKEHATAEGYDTNIVVVAELVEAATEEGGTEPNAFAPEVIETVHDDTASKTEVVKESAPVRPPPPRISQQIPPGAQFPYQEYLPYSLPQQPFYPVRNYSDDEAAHPQAPHRRRRHHRSRRDSTSEEEFQREQRRQRHGTRSPEPSIPSLGSQLIRACGSSIRETGDELMNILRASSKDENKRDLHIALIILIVIVSGLMALGMSAEKAVHHHHWDYFNPPGNSGNA